jgi:MATE family multidrug resistance protein
LPAVSLKRMITVAGPMIVSMLSLNIVLFVDRYFLARYNLSHFAASMPAGTINFGILSIFLGIAGYTATLVSQYFGAKRYHDCSKTLWQSIYFSLVSGLVLIALTPFIANIFAWMKHDPALIPLERSYFMIMMAAAPFMLLTNSLSGFFGGLGMTVYPMIASIAGNVFNIVFDYLLIFGIGPFPEMGIAGAALATSLSYGLQLIIFFIFLLNNKKIRHGFDLFHFKKFSKSISGKLLRFGFPAGFQYFIDAGGWSFFLLAVGRMGEISLTAATLTITVQSVAFLPMYGLSLGAGIIAGQERGAGRTQNIYKVLRLALKVSLIFNLFLLSLLLLFPEAIFQIFNSGTAGELKFDEALQSAIVLMRITCLWLLIDAALVQTGSILRAVGDTFFLLKVATFLSPIFLVILPLIMISMNLPLAAVWFNLVAFIAIYFIFVLVRFLSGKWKEINVIN